MSTGHSGRSVTSERAQDATTPSRSPTSERSAAVIATDVVAGTPSTATVMTRSPSEDISDDEGSERVSLSVSPEVKQYIEYHRLDKTISDLIKTLLNQHRLPYNPYKRLISKVRTQSERFVMTNPRYQMSMDSVINAEVADTSEWLTCPLKCDVIWGLEHVLQCVNPQTVLKYKWIVDYHQKQAQKCVHRLPHCDCRIVASLVGTCVFAGSIIRHPSPIQIRLEYLTWGSDKERAVEVFAISVVRDITETVQSKQTIAVELLVRGHATRTWSPQTVLQYQAELIEAVKAVTVAQRTVLLECLFKLSEHSMVYQYGIKQYVLTHTELSDDGPNRLFCYTDYPLSTLHTGIFFSKQHAHAYLSVFLPASVGRLTEHGVRDTHESVGASRVRLSNTNSRVGTQTATGIGTRRAATRQFHRGVQLTDGSEKVDHISPDDPRVTAKLRESWKRQVAGYHFQDKLFDIARSVMSLAVMDRGQFVPDTLPQLCSLYHSSAARLLSIVQFGNILERVLSEGNELVHLDQLMISVVEFRDQLLEFLNPAAPYIRTDYHSWMTHGLLGDRRTHYTVGGHIVTCDFIQAHFDQCLGQGLTAVSPTEQMQKVAECISNVTHSVQAIQLALIEDILSQCDVIQSVHFEVSQEYPTALSQRPTTPLIQTEKKTDRKGKKVAFDETGDRQTYKHGIEDEQMLSRDQLFLDVDVAVKRSTAPARIGRESVLIQYSVDTRLDCMFHAFFVDLLSDPHLPPNPFPKLANCLTQSLLKMQLWYESNRNICSRLVSNSIRQDMKGQEFFIYHIPECSAFGHYSSLSMIDKRSYRLVGKCALVFASVKTVMTRGNFKITVDTAVSGFTPLYGRVSPYLLTVELKEHLYVEGPESQEDEILMYFADFVLDDVMDLQMKKHQLVTGLLVGGMKVDVTEFVDAGKREYYLDAIIDVARRQQPVSMEAYCAVEWRYVLVVKQYCLHYLGKSNTQYTTYFPDNPVALYQNIWTLQEKAVRHFVCTLGSDANDPYMAVYTSPTLQYIDQQLSQCLDRMDLLSAYRWILTRTLVLKNTDADEIPEVWRMLHSLAGQLEYLHAVSTAMQELIQYELKCSAVIGPDTEVGVVRCDGVILGKMIDAYRQKLHSTLLSVSCHMGTETLNDQLQDKLKAVMKRHARTRVAELVISPKVVSVLEDVDVALRPIMNTAAAELHSLCGNSQWILQSVQRETVSRMTRRPHWT